MVVLNEYNILEELTVFLRNKDILTIGERGVTTTTDNFTGTGATATFTLTNSNVKNVRTVTKDGGVSQTNYTNYTAFYEGANAGKVVFSSNPSNGSVIAINYDYGADGIFPDFPRADLSLSSYPRVSLLLNVPASNDFDVGATATLNAPALTITVFDYKEKGVMDKVTSIRNHVNSSATSFSTFTYIRPTGTSQTFVDPARLAKVEQKSINYQLPYLLENK